MTVVNLEWAQARRIARDRRLTGDDLRDAVVSQLAAVAPWQARAVAFVGLQDDVSDLTFRAVVLMCVIHATDADPRRPISDSEHDARIRKVARDLDVSVIRVERALTVADRLSPEIDCYFGGPAS